MMDAKKEEADKLAAENKATLADKLNVMNIEVADDFEVDDIWGHWSPIRSSKKRHNPILNFWSLVFKND